MPSPSRRLPPKIRKRAAILVVIGVVLVAALISAFYFRDDINSLLAYGSGDWLTYEQSGIPVSQVPPSSNDATSSVASLAISTSTTTEDDTASYTLPSASYVFKNATFAKSLISSDGIKRGDLYVSYVTGTTSAASALYVVNKVNGNDEVIYATQSNDFINTAGNDFDSVDLGRFVWVQVWKVRNVHFRCESIIRRVATYEAEGILVRWSTAIVSLRSRRNHFE